jgi:hypothetical protein
MNSFNQHFVLCNISVRGYVVGTISVIGSQIYYHDICWLMFGEVPEFWFVAPNLSSAKAGI